MDETYSVGDVWRCFTAVREGRWGTGYSTTYTPLRWQCNECGTRYYGDAPHRYMAEHADKGHTPCSRCGVVLLNRKDGTPRQHAHNRCAGKTPGHKIEREFVKNMTQREMV
jgi:hypothetical protein